MLTALNEKGKLISLINVPQTFTKRNRTSHYYCPACEERLILKAGKIRIPHFAHKRSAECSILTTEPESPRHLLGKKHLYQHYKAKGLDIYLEHYLPEIRQRPDLFLKVGGLTYAIEYQCSPLPRQRLEERNAGYQELEILPIWILGSSPYKKRKNRTFVLSDFQFSLSTHHPHSGLTLLSYIPEKKAFLQLSQMISITSNTLLGVLQEFPLLNDKKSASVFDECAYDAQIWMNEKRMWLQQKVYYGNLHQDSFLKAIYTTGHNPFLLPEICGIPVPHAHIIHESPVIWQFYLYLDCLQGLPVGQKLSLKWVKQKVLKRINQGLITIRKFPLDIRKQYSWEITILEYFSMLTAMEYFSQIGEDLFMIKKSVKNPENIEETRLKENEIFQKDALRKLNAPNP
ncbi:competence protein CoiA [Bacillus sp. SD088]|uniref:competence protein CoiA n=1 Tax=Bacillus sp. SD088 TaxID=2782012 RepID=UPI001A959C9C|nr:competence protein CoiA family protein [Bacillus sp. SD088]MBO0993671.1 hypothetical protein [Bacillus sp. SD088]